MLDASTVSEFTRPVPARDPLVLQATHLHSTLLFPDH